MAVDLSFLDNFQEGFSPQMATQLPLLENVPDGNYDCTIISAVVTETKNSKQPIVKCMVQFEGIGLVAEKSYFLMNQENVNRLAGDFKTLGYEVDKWRKDCKLSQEIMKAINQLPGKRFKGTKKHNTPKGSDRTYHNLYVNSALPPSVDAEKLLKENAAVQSSLGGEEDDCPF